MNRFVDEIDGRHGDAADRPASGVAPELRSLPVGFPGETLFSRLCRYRVLVSDSVSRPVLRRLFNAPYCVPSSLLPARLGQLDAYFKGGLGIDTVIEENTALPFFRPFMAPDQWGRVHASTISGSSTGTFFAAGLAASRISPAHENRFCDECVARDLGSFGVSYWHREHALPGSLVCSDHERGLRSAALVFRQSRHALWLPHQILSRCAPALAFKPSETTALLEIAAASAEILGRAQPPLGLEALRGAYLRRARQIDIMAGQQSVKHTLLGEAVRSKWDDLFSAAPFRWIADANWAAMFRKPRSSKHPLRHIILAGALGISIRELLECSPATCRVPEAAPARTADRRARHDDHAGVLQTPPATARELAERLNVSLNTAIVRAARAGIQISKRPKMLTAEKIGRAEALYSRGLTVAEVCSTLKMSNTSAWRVLVSNAQLHERWQSLRLAQARDRYRSLWTEARASNPGALASATRRQHPSVYAWLYRNDCLWLKDCGTRRHRNTAPKQTFEKRASQDWSFSTAIMRAAQAVRSTEPPAGRASKRRLTILGRVPHSVACDAKRFPLVAAALTKSAESVDDYQVRRIRYWANVLLNEIGEAPDWLVARKSGLRKPFSARIRAELSTSQNELWHERHLHQAASR